MNIKYQHSRKLLTVVRHLMKLYITYLILLIATFLISCKARQNRGFIKTSKESEITLKSISSPYIVFTLQSGDTIKFGNQDYIDILEQSINFEIKKWGYSSSPHLVALAETLKSTNNDTTVYQNLSAVDSKTISGNLDSWIANRLLLSGKAKISLKGQKQNPQKLKYVYIRDVLGGEQGTFYFENREVYRAIISLGE
jgi:hypothetical protein